MKKIVFIPVLFLLLFSACGKSDKTNSTAALSAAVLEQSIIDEFSAVIEQTKEEAPYYLKKTEELSSFEISDFTSEDDGIAKATVTVSAPDLYSCVKALENESFACESDIDDALTEKLASAEIKVKEIEIQFYYNGEEWKPLLTEEFMDAYYGGFMTLRKEYLENNWEGSIAYD